MPYDIVKYRIPSIEFYQDDSGTDAHSKANLLHVFPEESRLDFSKLFPPELREEVENLINKYENLVFRGLPGMSNEK